jgi:HSP20 family protein
MPLEHIHPAIDIKETAKNFTVEVNLPGVKEENIKLRVSPTSLEISAHQEEKTEKEKKDYIYRERHDLRYYRRLVMPQKIDPDNVCCEYKNGVLEITLPKVPEEKLREIPVKKLPKKSAKKEPESAASKKKE